MPQRSHAPFLHAIVGCGRVAPNHVDGFRALAEPWEVGWACDREPARAREFAAAHGIAAATASAAEVFADPAVTSVSLTVDHAQHAPLAEQALTAGKHVLVEKPLALSVADGERLVRLAADRGRVLSVVSQHLYDPLVRAVHRWVKDGVLGRLLHCRVSLESSREEPYYADSYWRGTWAGEGGSAVINQGYHCLDVARTLCGELRVVASVARCGELFATMETEDTLSALLAAGEVPVAFSVTVGSTVTWRSRIELIGSAGTVEFDIDHPASLHRATGSAELERLAAVERARAAEEEPPGIDYYGVSHRRQIADFAQSVQRGEPMTASTGNGLRMAALITDLYAAAGLDRAQRREA
ncbi:Gfo/Idh/MocA family protein [Streptomyces varsoviensis]|uniref:Gfo/Idh/MocA family protein n=1 Tax=Streptomyces varsoviensis TaxID=67373 RepID=UPI0004CB7DA3|nr:Gfo/Idh/MocA family oxidoreductase [Streptomyces varsoviensis]